MQKDLERAMSGLGFFFPWFHWQCIWDSSTLKETPSWHFMADLLRHPYCFLNTFPFFRGRKWVPEPALALCNNPYTCIKTSFWNPESYSLVQEQTVFITVKKMMDWEEKDALSLEFNYVNFQIRSLKLILVTSGLIFSKLKKKKKYLCLQHRISFLTNSIYSATHIQCTQLHAENNKPWYKLQHFIWLLWLFWKLFKSFNLFFTCCQSLMRALVIVFSLSNLLINASVIDTPVTAPNLDVSVLNFVSRLDIWHNLQQSL